jgi:hypothetical protein
LKQFSENLANKFQPMEPLLGVTFNVETVSPFQGTWQANFSRWNHY